MTLKGGWEEYRDRLGIGRREAWIRDRGVEYQREFGMSENEFDAWAMWRIAAKRIDELSDQVEKSIRDVSP